MPDMLQINQIKGPLASFLKTEIFDSSVILETDTDLFESGFDSFSLIKLIVFIEKKFRIHIPEEKITEETFRNINSLSELIYAFQQE
ncbi:MAG: phosphopantetheine-binding protein [Desulfobacterales bacterium]